MALVSGAVAAALLLVVVSLILTRAPAPGETPESAVEAYLTALSEADAEAALEVIDVPPDTTHMTDDILARSLQEERISLVEVEELHRMDSDSVTEQVQATFTREHTNHDPSQIRFPFDTQLNEETGLWEIHDAAVRIPRPEVGDLDLKLNGEPFDAEETYVFWWPKYELTFDQEHFEFGHRHYSGMRIDSNRSGNPIAEMEVRLTEEGEDVWRQAISEDLESCLTSAEKQAGCGLDVRDQIDGGTVEEGSISRSLTTSMAEGGLAAIVPEVDPGQLPLVYSRGGFPPVDVEYETTSEGGNAESGDYAAHLHRPRVDMDSGDDPEVVWLEPGHGDLP